MSIANLSEGSSKRLRSSSMSQINADSNEADFSDVVTSSTGGDKDHAPGKFTEEDMTIHRIHRGACEDLSTKQDNCVRCASCKAKKQMYVDPSSGYKVFTEYAHLQRGKCCGSACRHSIYSVEVRIRNVHLATST